MSRATPWLGGAQVVLWGGLALVGCGGAAAEARPAAGPATTAPSPVAAPVYVERDPECPPPGFVTVEGRCAEAAPVTAAPSKPADSEPTRETPAAAARPNTVPGGLARGTGDEPDAALLEGDRAFWVDDLGNARKGYERARRLAPQDPAPRLGLLRVALAETGVPTDYAAAPKNPKVRALAKELDALVKQHPRYAPAHVERGRVLLIMGQAEPALRSLELGASLSPEDAEAHSALAVALLALGKSAEALDRFRRASELDPNNAARLTNLGTAYMMRGRVGDAVKAYQRAVELDPNDPRARGDLGTALLAANRVTEALPHLKRAVELAPERATLLSNLGYAYQQGGNLDLAIQTYRDALSKDERLGSAWINLGTALAQKQRYAEAEQAFRRAEQLDPTDPRVKANLQELEDLRRGGAPAPR